MKAFVLFLAVFLSVSLACAQQPSLTEQQQKQIASAGFDPANLQDIDRLSADGNYIIAVNTESAGATGNAEKGIFQLLGDHAVLLLRFEGSMHAVLPTIHHGLHDFVAFSNLSCCEGAQEVYQFDGRQYVTAYCMDATSDGDGEWHDGPRHPCKGN